MPTELHDISVAIGKLQAEIENARRSREVTHRQLEALSRQMEELGALARDVAMMKPEVQHYADARRRVAGAVTVLTLFAGGIGALMSELIKLVRH